jgi:8-oxo-dGTP diphosphatase
MPQTTEVIARGVLCGTRGILLCRQIGKENTFLPGGHIEFGEPAALALTREVKEELGMRVEVGDFFGVVENVYVDNNAQQHEINFVFEMSSPAIERRVKFTSQEAHLEFLWQPINMLAEANLLPKVLRTLIPQWSRGRHQAWSSEIRELNI